MHFYKHHIGDYASATTHLSWDEDMAYTRLLRVYYRDEKPLPADLEKIKRLTDCSTARRIAALQCVLQEFFVCQEDGYHNKRADAEIAAAGGQKEANRKVAIAREEAKRQARIVHEQSTIGSPPITQDPLPITQESKTQDPRRACAQARPPGGPESDSERKPLPSEAGRADAQPVGVTDPNEKIVKTEDPEAKAIITEKATKLYEEIPDCPIDSAMEQIPGLTESEAREIKTIQRQKRPMQINGAGDKPKRKRNPPHFPKSWDY